MIMICQVMETVSGKEWGMKYGDIPTSQGRIAGQVIQMCFLWGAVNSLCVQLLLCNQFAFSEIYTIIIYIIIVCIYI